MCSAPVVLFAQTLFYLRMDAWPSNAPTQTVTLGMHWRIFAAIVIWFWMILPPAMNMLQLVNAGPLALKDFFQETNIGCAQCAP
jgi:hypothetical protein